MAEVDLHLHTTASDGRLTPTELINLVAWKGLKVIALTDHDSTEGLAEALEAAREFPQLRVIPGIELSTDIPGNEVHILAYFIQYNDEGLQSTLQGFREGRLDRGRKMVDKLRDMGIDIEWKRVQEIAGDGSVGRPHVALAMVEKGYISEPKDAFYGYLDRNGSAYVERQKLAPSEAVELSAWWGGAAVLAHPAETPGLDDILRELKAAGLAGMEVHYAQYSPQKVRELAKVAKRYDLIPCGGSDYHALGNSNEPEPGTLGPPMGVVERLEKLAIGRARA